MKIDPRPSLHTRDSLEQEKRTVKSLGFFAVDRGAFRCAAIGGLNSAVAHLIMARGTGRDNRTTQWSVHSIEQRTGISRPNASKAIKDLLDRGIWKKIREGQHPIYEAVPGNQVPGGPFTADEQAAIAAIRDGKDVPYESNDAVKALAARGIVEQMPSSRRRRALYKLDNAAIVALTEPLAVWLPNTLIDGASNEVPPIELIRQTRSLPALRLLIELYAVQFLPNYGGVPRELLKVVFERAKVGEQGPFVVWGFRSKHMTTGGGLARPFLTGQFTTRDDGTRLDAGWDASFWPAVNTLLDLGLVERVGMLLDGDDNEAEIIHPYAIRDGEPAERELAAAAELAAQKMVTEGQLAWSQEEGYHLVPVLKHIANATVVEVFRLKYRPHTTATAAWYALMQHTAAEYLDHYQAMIKGTRSAHEPGMQYQG
jgi:DNA-binding transcriptional ArsR family regulator